jgi:hypothetical protein
MKKFQLFVFVVITTIIVASIYGVIHDQITYTISHEYYTKFKFIQFHLAQENLYGIHPRLTLILVGIRATWWMGLLIGLFFGLILLFFRNDLPVYRIYFRTISLTFAITILTGIFGYVNCIFTDIDTNGWYIPETLTDRKSFICVGSIHNNSYLGGIIGLLAGTCYLLILKEKYRIKKRTKLNSQPEENQ